MAGKMRRPCRWIFVVVCQNDASDHPIDRRREATELEEQEGPLLARCHHPFSSPPAACPPQPSPANRAGGRIPVPVPPCTTTNRPFAPHTTLIPLVTHARPHPTARERSLWQVCCTCSRAPRAARREARPSTPTAAQVRFLPPEAGPSHASDTLSHARASSPLTATTFLTPPLPSLASLAGSRRAGRRRTTTSCSTALASPWAAAHDFGRLRCVRCERVVHARACMLAHACPHLRARAARRSCLCRVGANCTGSVTCTAVVNVRVYM